MASPVLAASVLLVAVAQAGGQSTAAIPTKIESVPARAFGRGTPVTLKATFAKANVPPSGGVCSDPAFVIRLYDASIVASDPPRLSPDQTHTPAKPVTPYLQQTGVALDPLTGPDALRRSTAQRWRASAGTGRSRGLADDARLEREWVGQVGRV